MEGHLLVISLTASLARSTSDSWHPSHRVMAAASQATSCTFPFLKVATHLRSFAPSLAGQTSRARAVLRHWDSWMPRESLVPPPSSRWAAFNPFTTQRLGLGKESLSLPITLPAKESTSAGSSSQGLSATRWMEDLEMQAAASIRQEFKKVVGMPAWDPHTGENVFLHFLLHSFLT